MFLLPLLLLVPAGPDEGEARTVRRASRAPSIVSPVRTTRASATDPAPDRVVRQAGDVSAADHGPDVVVIDGLAKLFGAVRFDHAVHATMSRLEEGCASCHHRQDAAATRVLACRACHATGAGSGTFDMPGLKAAYHRQCLACHRDWSGENACGSCHEERGDGAATPVVVHDPGDIVGATRWGATHPGATDPGATNPGATHPRATQAHLDPRAAFVFETTLAGAPFVTFQHADHVEQFGVTCVECHRGSSCRSCHGSAAATERVAIDRHDRCFTCHAGDRCALCHDQAPRPRFEHEARSGWSLGPHHASRACADCHGAPQAFVVPAARSCRACHANADPSRFDHAATGVPLAGSHARFECARCHDERRPDAAPTCSACHPDRAYPQQWPGLATPSAPRTLTAERPAAPVSAG